MMEKSKGIKRFALPVMKAEYILFVQLQLHRHFTGNRFSAVSAAIQTCAQGGTVSGGQLYACLSGIALQREYAD